MSIILRNGQTWENQAGERAITQWLGGSQWCLLGLPIEAPHGGTHMVPLVDEHGYTIWPHEELARRLGAEHWRRLPNFGMQIPMVDVDAPPPGTQAH
jgi:hypothetical protein